MATIMIADGQVLGRDLMAAMLEREGYVCLSMGTGTAAWERLQLRHVDLLVTETELTGLEGLDLVEEVRKGAETRTIPVIILTNSHDKARVVRAAALGIHGYFLKSQVAPERLLSRIRELIGEAPEPVRKVETSGPTTEDAKAGGGKETAARRTSATAGMPKTAQQFSTAPSSPRVAPAAEFKESRALEIPQLLLREQTIKRLDQVAGGKTIAGVVAQVIALANSPEADLADLVRVLESDPTLATRVLQAANSASTGAHTRIRTVEDGVRTLGVREIRNLAFNIGIFGAFPPNEADGFNTLRCWQHSFTVADLVGQIGRERDHYVECVNHLAGLCHDLGEILLRQHFAVEYKQILGYAMATGMPVHDVEHVALGLRHPELLSRLLSRIGLPQPVVHAIREFFERQVKGQEGGMGNSARVLLMANQLAHGMLLAASTLATVAPISRTEWLALGTGTQPPILDPVAKRNEIICTTNLLARLPAKDEVELTKPLLPKRAWKVWYLRSATYIDMDPLGMALSMMCEVKVSPSLPAGEEWDAVDGLVVTGFRVGAPPIVPEELARACERCGRPELPTLILAGQDPGITRIGALKVRSYPISLGELNQWLGSLKARRAVTV